MTDLDSILIAAHRGNINRYRRLLRTQLTDLERDFITRRLSEEQSALDALLARKRASAARVAQSQVRGSMVAADALARRRDGTLHSR